MAPSILKFRYNLLYNRHLVAHVHFLFTLELSQHIVHMILFFIWRLPVTQRTYTFLWFEKVSQPKFLIFSSNSMNHKQQREKKQIFLFQWVVSTHKFNKQSYVLFWILLIYRFLISTEYLACIHFNNLVFFYGDSKREWNQNIPDSSNTLWRNTWTLHLNESLTILTKLYLPPRIMRAAYVKTSLYHFKSFVWIFFKGTKLHFGEKLSKKTPSGHVGMT